MEQKHLKDHDIAALINELRDTAIQFHGTQQLRARLASVVKAALASPTASIPDFAEYMTAEYGPQYALAAYPADAMSKCWTAAQAAAKRAARGQS